MDKKIHTQTFTFSTFSENSGNLPFQTSYRIRIPCGNYSLSGGTKIQVWASASTEEPEKCHGWYILHSVKVGD